MKISKCWLLSGAELHHGFSVRNATPYPFKGIVICAAGVTEVADGPLVALVVASIVNRLPLVKVPRAETSTSTLIAEPGPLLSVMALTA